MLITYVEITTWFYEVLAHMAQVYNQWVQSLRTDSDPKTEQRFIIFI